VDKERMLARSRVGVLHRLFNITKYCIEENINKIYNPNSKMSKLIFVRFASHGGMIEFVQNNINQDTLIP